MVETKPKKEVKGLKNFNMKIDYYDLAKNYIEDYPIYFNRNKLWWIWNFEFCKWEIIDETDILISIKEAFDDIDTINSNVKSQIIESLRQAGRKKKPKDPKKSWIQFKETIIDIETGERFLATSEYFITNPIPFSVGESEDTPEMDKLFVDWVGEKGKDMLYEIIAYCCLADYPIHRLFCFTGSGRNGKSKYLQLIDKFVGGSNVCAASLDRISNPNSRFESVKLYKKLVCQMGETNFNILNDTELIKKLTGQDKISFEFKNKDGFDDYNYAKILIATNTLPATKDKTIGFYSRWSIVDFPNCFKETNNLLERIPEIEFNNLTLKTIRILKDLLNRDGEEKFTGEGDIKKRMERYEEKSNPLENYLKINTERNINCYVFKYDLRDKFEIFCKQRGFRKWSDKEIKAYMLDNGYDEGRHTAEWYKQDVQNNSSWASWDGLKWLESVSVVPNILIDNSASSTPTLVKKKVEIENGVSQVSQVSQHNTTRFPCSSAEVKKGDYPDYPDNERGFDYTTIKQQIYELCKNPIKYTLIQELFQNVPSNELKSLMDKMKSDGLIFETHPDTYRTNNQ